MNYPNPTGKGGFREHPELSDAGRWKHGRIKGSKNKATLSAAAQEILDSPYLKIQFRVETPHGTEFKTLDITPTDSDDRSISIAQALATVMASEGFKGNITAIKELKEWTEGASKQHVSFDYDDLQLRLDSDLQDTIEPPQGNVEIPENDSEATQNNSSINHGDSAGGGNGDACGNAAS
jgi:hypothetical protein